MHHINWSKHTLDDTNRWQTFWGFRRCIYFLVLLLVCVTYRPSKIAENSPRNNAFVRCHTISYFACFPVENAITKSNLVCCFLCPDQFETCTWENNAILKMSKNAILATFEPELTQCASVCPICLR